MINFIEDCSKFIQDLRKYSLEEYALYLSDIGRTMLQRAYDEKTFNNETYNLADSYAWALYYNGLLVNYGFLTTTERATEDKYGERGRSVVEDFIKSEYNSTLKDGYELIFVAAIFYGKYLERPDLDLQARAEGYTYEARQVISYIWDDLAVIFKPHQVTQL